MGTAAVVVAAAAAREQARVLECFRLADATAADRAQTLDRLGLVGNPTVERFSKAGVLMPGTAPHTVYLSESAYAAYRRGTRGRALWVVVAVGLTFIAAGIALFVVASRGQ
jgi:hypothetical protein